MEKAIIDLEKLERSDKLPDPEKKAAREAKEYLQSRDSEKAFTAVHDKIAISRISFSLLMSRLKELEQVKEIQSNPEGKRMCEIQRRINTQSGDIKKLSEVNTYSLAAEAKGLLKDVLGN